MFGIIVNWNFGWLWCNAFGKGNLSGLFSSLVPLWPPYPLSATHLFLCVWLRPHIAQTHTQHCDTETGQPPRGFCPVIWHIFDVNSKRTKWENAGGVGEQRSNLGFPLLWKTLFVEHSSLNHPTHKHIPTSLHPPPPFPPFQILGGFFIKCYQKCDWSYSWVDGGFGCVAGDQYLCWRMTGIWVVGEVAGPDRGAIN